MNDERKPVDALPDQATLWNTSGGDAWVALQPVIDAMFAPIEEVLVSGASIREGGSVLDIGCGAGATTLAMARRVGPRGSCLGVDISEPLVARAKERASAEGMSSVSFVRADVQTHPFTPESFDAVISRFGVMFFDDPEAAFENVLRAMRPAGTLRFVAWRSPADNPFMTAAARATASLLPDLRAPNPDLPGQWAFADGDRVRRILGASGWADVDVSPIDVHCALPEAHLLSFVTRLGPVGQALRDADDATRARVIEALGAAFASFVRDGAARYDAACWLATARRLG